MSYPHDHHKVAIPRLDRGPLSFPKVSERNREDRVTRACKTCRKRKVKCSGGLPQCLNCQANSLECIYEQARRDRLKEATDLNNTFVTLLTELIPKLGEDDRRKIQDVIDSAEDDMIFPHPASSVKSLGKRARKSSVEIGSPDPQSPTKKHGEAYVTASVGSNEDLDFLDEDLLRTRESRETGYVGQNSEVQWLRSMQRHSESDKKQPYGLPYGPPGTSDDAIDQRSEALHQRRQGSTSFTHHVTDATFYLDSDNIELDLAANPYDLPDPEIAENLLDCYMRTVHTSFPIVPLSFEDQVRRFLGSLKQNKAFHVPDRWRALMNLIFAIGAKYSHLIGAEWRGDERDHLVYMTRASHLLGMNNTIMLISGPDLALVQATAVFSFYFLTIGHVSRAWLMIGISIRLALALGLHLRNEDPHAETTKKEMLVRTWWSLHCIECLVSSITGRPPIIANEDCTVPLPRVLPGELHHSNKGFRRPSTNVGHESPGNSRKSSSSPDGQYLGGTISISILTQRVLTGLYAPRTAVHSWQDVQSRIKVLLSDLEDWAKDSLSGPVTPFNQETAEMGREQLLLRMHYWSTMILITRPCLCRTERRIKSQSDTSAHFNAKMAETCVASARELTNLLPDEPTPKFIYEKAPWWSIIHIIMQCAAVMLLEVAYQHQHVEDKTGKVTSDVQKLLNWLRVMQHNDAVARRAYYVVRRILQNTAPGLHAKAAELLKESPETHQSAEDQPFGALRSIHDQRSSQRWVQGEDLNRSIPNTDHHSYPPGLAANQNWDYTAGSSYEFPTHTDLPHEQLRMTTSFGNPFLTSWDEGPPVIDMYNMWNTANHPSYPHDVGDMDLLSMYTESQQPHGADEGYTDSDLHQ